MHRVDAVTHQQAGAHGTKFNVGDKVRLSPGFKDEGASASASASASTARTHVCASSKRAVTYQTHMNLGGFNQVLCVPSYHPQPCAGTAMYGPLGSEEDVGEVGVCAHVWSKRRSTVVLAGGACV